MTPFNLVLIWFSALSFIFYGISYYLTSNMKDEFLRFGLEKYAFLTSTLQVLGGIGLIVGMYYHPILLISSGGLALLMFFGFLVRLKVKDGFWRSLPAFLYLILNSYLFMSNYLK
jgi:hypothetical protein